MFKKHPKGLPVLFFTEMWERFGFYLMLGIFTLYMIDSDGMNFSKAGAADIYGTYLALVYLTPFVGGLLADRILGYRLSITIGGALMGLGYIGLALPGELTFYLSLLLVIVGNGFFKPNISTLVGNLYNNEKYKDQKDAGFNIFYMGINIGAFVCNFIAAYLRLEYGWGYAFAAAGIGMFIGLIWFWTGQKHVKEADVIKPTQKEDMPLGQLLATIFLPAGLAGAAGWFLPTMLFGGTLMGSNSTDAFVFAAIPVLLFYLSLYLRASKEDKAPIGALLSVFGVVIIFWAIFHQNGSALTLWAKDYTNREMPAVVESVAEFANLVEVVDTTQTERALLDSHGIEKLDADGNVIKAMGPHYYLDNLPKDQWPKGDGEIKLLSTEIFQSVNPGFVVFLTPLVVGLFGFLRKRGIEPSTPAKIGWGMIITALSTTVMMVAVVVSNNGLDKSSAMFLVTSYGIITFGELFLSPMGLSLVSKLSPPRITALMMGGWFLATAVGNKLSGVISGLWDTFDNKVYFFGVNFVGALFGAALIFMMVKWLTKVVVEHTGQR